MIQLNRLTFLLPLFQTLFSLPFSCSRVKGNEGSGDWEADFKDSSSEASEFDGCRLAGSDSSSELGSDTGSLLDENLGNRTTGVCPGCKEKKKLFEYTEKGPPYCRVPLLEKVVFLGPQNV